MTVFAKRAMNDADRLPVEDQMDALQLAMGAPLDLMMFWAESDERSACDVYIGLPDAGLLAAFPGFVEVSRDALPDRLSTIIVREDGFEERFPDILKKRQNALRP